MTITLTPCYWASRTDVPNVSYRRSERSIWRPCGRPRTGAAHLVTPVYSVSQFGMV